jgi:hypothetical protein
VGASATAAHPRPMPNQPAMRCTVRTTLPCEQYAAARAGGCGRQVRASAVRRRYAGSHTSTVAPPARRRSAACRPPPRIQHLLLPPHPGPATPAGRPAHPPPHPPCRRGSTGRPQSSAGGGARSAAPTG